MYIYSSTTASLLKTYLHLLLCVFLKSLLNGSLEGFLSAEVFLCLLVNLLVSSKYLLLQFIQLVGGGLVEGGREGGRG